MTRAGRIHGRVTDVASGDALQGARVMTGDEYSDDTPRDWADHEGRYAIRGVKPGPTTVTVHLSGHAPELKTVQVTAGETAQLDFMLGPGAILAGMVKNEHGAPIAGAYVEATRWRDHSTLGLRAVASETGAFVIFSAPHDEFEITAGAPGHGQVRKTVKADPNTHVEITLPEAPNAASPEWQRVLKVGDTAPVLTLTTLDGATLDLAGLKGKTILLDFWATWCAPCVEELQYFVEVYEKFGSRNDFVVIGINRDFDELTLRRFLKKNDKLKWHHVHESPGGREAAVKAFGVTWLPSVFLIGPCGKILSTALREKEIVKRVEELLTHDKGPT